MTRSMRIATPGLRAALVVVVAAAALALVAAHSRAAAGKAHTATCSARGLSPTRKHDGVTEGVTVSKLRATVATCATARTVAHGAAVALLDHDAVPRKIDGYTLSSKAPCVACTPQRTVTATASRGRRITFVLFG